MTDERLTHARSCPELTPGSDDYCTCGLTFRIQLATEQEMHAAWRKRAEEAESELLRLRADPVRAELEAAKQHQKDSDARIVAQREEIKRLTGELETATKRTNNFQKWWSTERAENQRLRGALKAVLTVGANIDLTHAENRMAYDLAIAEAHAALSAPVAAPSVDQEIEAVAQKVRDMAARAGLSVQEWARRFNEYVPPKPLLKKPAVMTCPACDCQWPARMCCKTCNGMGEIAAQEEK